MKFRKNVKRIYAKNTINNKIITIKIPLIEEKINEIC